jgi:hypothetical protein
MADNIPLPNSTLVTASDEISGVQYQRVKLTLGNDGINDGDVSSTNPIPVNMTGVSTEVTLLALKTALDALSSKIVVSNTGSITGTVSLDSTTLAALESITAAVTGTVSVSNFSIGLTDAEIRATPLPVSGTVGLDSAALTALENISVTVTNSATEITNDSGNPIPISGTITVANPGLTDAQLRATSLPVSIDSIPSHAVTNVGTFVTQVNSSVLPTGAATETTLSALKTVIDQLKVVVDSLNTKTTTTNTDAVAIIGSVLPTGAATEVTTEAVRSIQETIQAQTEVIEYALMALLDKTSVPDRYDRNRVVISDTSGNEISGAYYGINVATVGDPNNGRLYSRISEPWNFHDMSSNRIYDRIAVS